MEKEVKDFFKYLKGKDSEGNKILFIATSNRWSGSDEKPKSTTLAIQLSEKLANCEVLDISKLKIFPCEGNVSRSGENRCGLKESVLKDKKKNPTGDIRCWASINNPTDEMYVVANKIFESDIIVFFGSVRWGKMSAIYSNLIERLTWLEARWTTLGESNLLKDKECGVVAFGHNWNGANVLQLELDVLKYFGFKTPKQLSFNRQWTNDPTDESQRGYKKDFKDFMKELEVINTLKESLADFSNWIKKINS
jgi:multimeric flavodoxin WrbA